MHPVLQQLADVARRANDVEWDQRSGGELRDDVLAVERIESELAALVVQVVGAFDASGRWADDGCRSSAGWLAHDGRLARPTARRQLRHARALCAMPVARAALMTGEISLQHVAVLVRALDRLERHEFVDDWAAARAEHGGAATASDLPRTPAQRRADALVRMAQRSASALAGARKPAPLVNLHMDWATFCAELAATDGSGQHTIGPDDGRASSDQRSTGAVGAGGREGPRLCELDDGTVLLPSQFLEQALRGEVRRVVFGPDGHILDFGRTKRLYDGGLRQAIKVRDRHCTAPGCDVPAKRCEVDHVVPWSRAGTTSEANGRLHCDHHNRSRQEGDP